MWDYANFRPEEFICPCCGEQRMEQEFMERLQILRELCGFPFIVTSGWRCENYNRKVSPESSGDHTRGLAVDISLTDRYNRWDLLKYITQMLYFKDIAIGKTFIHIGKGRNRSGIGVYER